MAYRPIPSNLETILFDLDGTLVYSRPSSHHAFQHFVRQAGAPVSVQAWRSALRWAHYYWAASPEIEADIVEHGKATPEFWHTFSHRYLLAFGVEECQADVYAPKVTDYFARDWHRRSYVPVDIPCTLHHLREAGYTLGVVTNREKACRDELDEIGLGQYFHFSVAAGEIGFWKPDPAIFHHALALIGASSERTIYIGDNYYADVEGAANAGLLPILIDPDRIFPEVDCPVIDTISAILPLLRHD